MHPSFSPIICLALLLMGCALSPEGPARPLKESFYDHEGVNIRFREMGRGTPVVFIHGFGASLDTWRYLIDSLKDGHRLILLDLKGHGLSDRPLDDRYSLDDHAEVVLGLIRHLGLKQVTIVGHSLGSIIAVAAALRDSETGEHEIAGLAVIDGALDPQYVPFFLNLLRIPLVGSLSVKLTTARFRTRLMLLRAFYDHAKVTDELVDLYAQYQRIPGTEHAMIATAKRMVPENLPLLKSKLSALEIPVLNLWGEHDVIIKRPGAESVCNALPRCRLVVIPDSGHIPQEEAPEAVIPLLREFLDQVSAGSFAGGLDAPASK